MFSSALLPGPGTYQPKFEAAELFERPPSAKLKPKRNAAVPRKVILPETLDILHSPAQKQPAGKLIRRFLLVGHADFVETYSNYSFLSAV